MAKYKKIIVVLGVVVILFSFCFDFSNVCAEINTTYGNNTPSITANGLEETIESNIIIDALGSFLYSIAEIFENIVTWIFEKITGVEIFPWADKVIFNTIPLLDINFINPSSGSFFETINGESTAIATVISNTYYTIFIIAVALLGVCIGIMALRLIFASIASEKAKYKQAITKLAMAMIMLFLSHYIISFIFFLNEKMVEVATSILDKTIQTIEENNFKLSLQLNNATPTERRTIVSNFVTDTNVSDAISLFNPISNVVSIISDIADVINYIKNDNSLKTTAISISQDPTLLYTNDTYLDYTYYLLIDSYYVKNELSHVFNSGDGGFDRALESLKIAFDFTNSSKSEIVNLCSDVAFLSTIDNIELESEATSKISEYVENNRKNKSYIKKSLLGAWERKKFGTTELTADNTFVGLGEFFKSSAWSYTKDDYGTVVGWKPGKISIIGVILYAMFIVESIMYFSAYLKRFFYVIMLALFAPLVIIYDFFVKSMN